ncbi:MAG: MmcQ/YjbR family DNA-binding protein [Actinomycetota bacterium]
MISHDDVRRLALELPGSFERASHGGRPSFRTKPRLFAWIRDDPEALVVWVESVEEKEMLLAADPAVFFTTDHYDGHPIVLVRLETVDVDEARELIIDSFRHRAPKKLVAPWDAANPPTESS